MSRTIWKFPLAGEYTKLEMPKGSRILSVHRQHDETMLWALVHPECEKESRVIWVLLTGSTVPHVELKFIGTVLSKSENFVLHAFEQVFE